MTVEFFLIRCDFVFVLLCKRNFIELALLSCGKSGGKFALCPFWVLWMKRNRRTFEDAKQSEQAIKSSICS